MKPQNVRLFIKTFCPWCHKAEHWLEKHGVSYETIDVLKDDASMSEMIKLSDQDCAPVIDVDGKILADFGPDELEEWWKEQGFDAK